MTIESIARSAASASEKTLRVLIVDDDALERELYRHFLELDETVAYTLSEADTGAAGLEGCEFADHDCILLDYCLPDTDGLRLMGELQRETAGCVPIILMTGVGNERIAVDVLKAGAADYLLKSEVTSDSLTRAIAGAVEKARLREKIKGKERRIRNQNAELQRSQKEIQRFYQNVSHELKTPLTSMQEFASIIIDGLAGPLSDEQRQYVGLIHASCVELASEVDALLELSQLESDECRLERCGFDIDEVIERAVREKEEAAQKNGVVLRHESEDDLRDVHADPLRCAEILSKLLSNAIKFTDASGDGVCVTARNDDTSPDKVIVAVTDSGCGIEKAELEPIFERLYQADPSSHLKEGGSSTTGLGLGLAIARRLVELQDGHLWVESEVGVGSVFAFSLPAGEQPSRERDVDVSGSPSG